MHVLPVGRVNGPPSPITQKSTYFHIVLGLFDSEASQAVHVMRDGTQRPIVWLSMPLPIEEDKILL